MLYAPGLTDAGDIAKVVGEVDRPVNFVMGLAVSSLDLAALAALGVKRFSVGKCVVPRGVRCIDTRRPRDERAAHVGFSDDAVGNAELSSMLDH